MHREEIRVRYERASQWPLVVVALLFVTAYAWQVLRTGLPDWAETTLTVVTLAAWPIFLADYVVRLVLAERRWRFVRRNWVDGLAVLLPLLRPLRIISLVRVARVLDRKLTGSLHGRVAWYVSAIALLISFMASLAVYDAERDAPDAVITSYGDAVWWALTTITTVGYGDTYPVTTEGRLVAVLLMVGGIALLGVVTAAVASWFVGRVADAAQADRALEEHPTVLQEEVRQLAEEVRRLRAELGRRRDDVVTDDVRTTGGR
ncbi:potassium channel family protein [Modestobacter roseus]|uniref:Voltage-gated potassium channel n=1 Tax=Modestobacter roseus TaxID=1181884 RepID=A0A562IN32_9ACTN|nr:potassium channel family protein [Modestobacter roseus]MQA32478.1 two pore domain potassium channel family protein [Modestobacter roseus]TWH72256.1 voltage-gated potassium channel [Modestobacter roseus]